MEGVGTTSDRRPLCRLPNGVSSYLCHARKGPERELDPADEGTADENQKTSSQELTKGDSNKREKPSKVVVEPRRSKRGQIPKKQFELNPDKKKYQYP